MAGGNGSLDPGRDVGRPDDVRTNWRYASVNPPRHPHTFRLQFEGRLSWRPLSFEPLHGLCRHIVAGGFQGSVPKPAPPSDHTPLRRRCAFSECRPFLMFFKSTPGRRGNPIIPSPPLFGFYPVTESVALPPEARWNAMTDYPAAIPMFAIQQLRCPKCRARMKLARTSPGPTGFELKRFDCSECDQRRTNRRTVG